MTISAASGGTCNELTVVAPLHIPDVTGLSQLEAALAYATAGWYLVPTAPGHIKNPGSIVGGSWHTVNGQLKLPVGGHENCP